MSICALVGATEFNREHFLSQSFDFVIAVDKGYQSLLEIGVVPDLVVGDFDSLGYIPNHENVSVFPSEKDESDMELAIGLAKKNACSTLLVYGALAERLDHTIANLQLMLLCARDGLRVYGVGRDFIVAILDGKGNNSLCFRSFDPMALDSGRYGRYLSVFAIGGEAYGVCERGLKYSLDDFRLCDQSSLGLSNEFVGDLAAVEVERGSLIVTFSSLAWDYLAKMD